jgi:WD40 repeat protein
VDIGTGEVIHELDGHRFLVRCHAFNTDGSLLLTGSVKFGAGYNDYEGDDTGELILWDTRTGELIRRFDETEGVFGVLFSPDSQYAYTATIWGEKTAKVWDVATGQELGQFHGFIALRLGLEENTVLSDLALVDTNALETIRRFVGDHTGGVMTQDISPDGSYLISGGTNGDLILWDYATGEQIRQFSGHTTTIWNAFFSTDGRSAYSSGYDGVVFQWRIEDWALDELRAWVQENRYIREFTCDERVQYNIEPLCE